MASTCEASYTLVIDNPASIVIDYDTDRKEVKYVVNLIENSFVSLGYGEGMGSESDPTYMVLFQANSDQSQCQTMTATGHKPPEITTPNEYTFSYEQIQANNTVTITAYRKLNTENPNGNYIIPLDQDFSMIYAYNNAGYELDFHGSNYGFFKLQLSSTGDSSGAAVSTGLSFFALHGIFMSLSWTFFGMLIVISQRYLKHLWFGKQIIHSFSALVIFSMTMGFGIKGITSIGGVDKIPHAIAGVIMLGLCFLATVGGIIMIRNRMASNYDWNTEKFLKMRKIHKMVGYFVLLGGQVTILLGLLKKSNGKFAYLMGPNVALIVLVLGPLEYFYQKKWSQQEPYKTVQAKMSVDQFNAAIETGSKLVILDNMVLDVKDFTDHHPGGRFVLTHNIGRDISKFFYGGYNLEGNSGANPKPGYNHSNYSRMVVNKLIVAQLSKDQETASCTLNQKKSSFASQSKLIRTYFLKSGETKRLTYASHFYKELSMIGKHYLVSHRAKPNVLRHYTIANCMVPEVYQELVRSMSRYFSNSMTHSKGQNINNSTNDNNSYLESQTISEKGEELKERLLQPSNSRISNQGEFDLSCLDPNPSQEVVLTIKYYDSLSKGLSFRFWDESQHNQYEVCGPLGKGLELNELSSGTHIVFAAGTGVLCFADIVAHLAYKNMGVLDKIDGAQKLPDDFKLVLYVSFRSQEESCCLEMCEALKNMNKALGKDNFELHVRLSQKSQQRWDYDFIRNEVVKHSALQKIWVCGPPVMNETFDKSLSSLVNENLKGSKNFVLRQNQFEIL